MWLLLRLPNWEESFILCTTRCFAPYTDMQTYLKEIAPDTTVNMRGVEETSGKSTRMSKAVAFYDEYRMEFHIGHMVFWLIGGNVSDDII